MYERIVKARRQRLSLLHAPKDAETTTVSCSVIKAHEREETDSTADESRTLSTLSSASSSVSTSSVSTGYNTPAMVASQLSSKPDSAGIKLIPREPEAQDGESEECFIFELDM